MLSIPAIRTAAYLILRRAWRSDKLLSRTANGLFGSSFSGKQLPMSLTRMNRFVERQMKRLEMVGVLMRIFSFSLVSWMGPESPFLFVWAFNTVDAILLTWCAALKRDSAYLLLNSFWILVGLVGIARSSQWIH